MCGKPSQARQLCDTHYSRWSDHGDPNKTLRPADWGKRSNHPLNEAWCQTKRSKFGRVERWNDLYVFAEDVGERPSPLHRLRRFDLAKPWGPDNFEWRETLKGRTYTLNTRLGKAEYQRIWRAANPLKAKGHNLKKYGITLEQYSNMLDAQGGVCAICESHDKAFAHLAVDHCHTTGKVRGLLCNKCNRAIGIFGDDLKRLGRAVAYLGGLMSPK